MCQIRQLFKVIISETLYFVENLPDRTIFYHIDFTFGEIGSLIYNWFFYNGIPQRQYL